jgi:hypothetical protein
MNVHDSINILEAPGISYVHLEHYPHASVFQCHDQKFNLQGKDSGLKIDK